MEFFDNFKTVCKLSDPNFEDLDDFHKEILQGKKAFSEAYEISIFQRWFMWNVKTI